MLEAERGSTPVQIDGGVPEHSLVFLQGFGLLNTATRNKGEEKAFGSSPLGKPLSVHLLKCVCAEPGHLAQADS